MLEALAAWREVLHVSEWTGMSVGALAGLALLGYLAWPIAIVRYFVLIGAFVIVTNYGTAIYVNHVSRADVMAQWNEAKAAAEEARKNRDATIAREIEAKYAPQIADQQKQVGELDAQVRDYEKQILAQLAGGGGRCELGDDALRLRNGKAARASVAARRPANKNLRANSPRG